MWHVKFEPTKSQALTISRSRSDWQIPPIWFDGAMVADLEDLRLHHGPWPSVRHPSTLNRHLGWAADWFSPKSRSTHLVTKDSFVDPLLEYPPLAWDGAAASHLSRLDRVQHHALSLVIGRSWCDCGQPQYPTASKWSQLPLQANVRVQGPSTLTADHTPTPPTTAPAPESGVSTNPYTAFDYRTHSLCTPATQFGFVSLQLCARLEHLPARSPAVAPTPQRSV